MASKPTYVREYKDRHGVTRLEFRRRGYKGWALRQPLRSDEFWEDYNAAMEGRTPAGHLIRHGRRPEQKQPAQRKSLRWLIEEYKTSAAYQGLAPSTKSVRNRILDGLSIEYGDFPYSGLTQQAVLKLRDKKSHVPETANALVKALRQVYKYALDYGFEGIESNPTRDVVPLRSHNPDGFHAWTTDEVEQFEQAHPIGTKARLALGLMLYAGCARRSDVVVLGKQHLTRNGRLHYIQFKGRNKKPVHIDIRVIEELEQILSVSPCGDLFFLVTEFGRQFTSKGFGNWFKKRCTEANLPHCSAHGVRKAAAARLAELGCSDHEIMAIGGWQTIKEVQRYTKGARKRVLSDSAMDKVQADIDRTKVSNLSADGKKVRQ